MRRYVFTRYGLIILLLLVLGGLLGVWFIYRSYVGGGDIRNVLLISIDTCRADYLSCYGYESKTTPNIDAVAAEGILFENVISPIPETLPAHASMLTGTIPPYHGVHDNKSYHFKQSNISLAEILKDAGFATGAVISAVVLDSQLGIDQGFDDYYDRFENLTQGELIQERKGGETTDVALEWLEKNSDKRFFFFLHYYDPHTNYEPPEPFASRFASNLYAGEIAYTDHCIGRVLNKLKELGLYDSTLVIITSDHGEMLGEHDELTHTYFIYQGAIRVPLIFKLPGQNKPARIKSIAGLIDIVPTICGLLNIEAPKGVQGIDLFASSEGKDTSAQNRHVYCESLMPTNYKANSLLGIVNDRFKYIQTTRPELYDLIKDPGESNNLVVQQQHQARIMQDKLAQMLEQSVRKDSGDSRVAVDPETMARLGALGYVGGAVTEDFSFDQTKDDPKDLLKYHSLAEQLVLSSATTEYEKIKMYAEQMIQQRPDLPIPYEKLGLIAMRKKDYSKAIICFQKVIEIDPNHSWADQKRGLAHLKKGDYDQAIRIFGKVIELNPHHAKVYSNRAEAYTSKGNYEQAIRDFDEAIKLNPTDARAYNNRGFAYRAKGDYNRAIRDFDKVIELDPNSTRAYNNRGKAYQGKGDYEQAIRDFGEAIRLNPREAKAYNNRANAYTSKGNYERAIRDFYKITELNPSDAMAHNNLAWILATHEDAQLRDGAQAVRLAERACELTNYKTPEILDSLAAAYAQAGQFDKAVEVAAKAVQLARAAKSEKLANDIQSRLKLYKAKRPYRESFSPEGLGGPKPK